MDGMMKRTIFTITFILLATTTTTLRPTYAYFHKFALKGGLGAGLGKLTSYNSKEDYFPIGGIITHYGYRSKKWEYNLFSNIMMGHIQDVTFLANGTLAGSEGTLRALSIGPQFKYFTDYRPATLKYPSWHLYIAMAPLWGVKAIYLDNNEGDLDPNHKLVYNSTGFSINIGTEDYLKDRDNNPFYIELQYLFMTSHKVSVVDYSDEFHTKVVSTEKALRHTRLQVFMINIGITIL